MNVKTAKPQSANATSPVTQNRRSEWLAIVTALAGNPNFAALGAQWAVEYADSVCAAAVERFLKEPEHNAN